MGHFSMETYAPTGSNLSGNQHARICRQMVGVNLHGKIKTVQQTEPQLHILTLSQIVVPCCHNHAVMTLGAISSPRQFRSLRPDWSAPVNTLQKIPQLGRR